MGAREFRPWRFDPDTGVILVGPPAEIYHLEERLAALEGAIEDDHVAHCQGVFLWCARPVCRAVNPEWAAP